MDPVTGSGGTARPTGPEERRAGPDPGAELGQAAGEHSIGQGGISPRRQAASDALVRRIDALVRFVIDHWLALVNLAVALFIRLALLAPLLLWLGWTLPARAIYTVYGFVCHQLPYRSFFLFGDAAVHPLPELSGLLDPSNPRALLGTPELGFKLAFCQRDLAIYAAVLAGGLIFAVLRRRWRPIPLRLFLVFAIPIAVDGFSQLPGWRESTWELRVVTGAIFGLAAVRFVYPYFERAMRQARADQLDQLSGT